MTAQRNPWLHLPLETMGLAFDAQNVIGLRLVKAAFGGPGVQAEAQLMIAEKSKAAWDANVILARSLLSGQAHLAPARAVALYRRRVKANRRRLTRDT